MRPGSALGVVLEAGTDGDWQLAGGLQPPPDGRVDPRLVSELPAQGAGGDGGGPAARGWIERDARARLQSARCRRVCRGRAGTWRGRSSARLVADGPHESPCRGRLGTDAAGRTEAEPGTEHGGERAGQSIHRLVSPAIGRHGLPRPSLPSGRAPRSRRERERWGPGRRRRFALSSRERARPAESCPPGDTPPQLGLPLSRRDGGPRIRAHDGHGEAGRNGRIGRSSPIRVTASPRSPSGAPCGNRSCPPSTTTACRPVAGRGPSSSDSSTDSLRTRGHPMRAFFRFSAAVVLASSAAALTSACQVPSACGPAGAVSGQIVRAEGSLGYRSRRRSKPRTRRRLRTSRANRRPASRPGYRSRPTRLATLSRRAETGEKSWPKTRTDNRPAVTRPARNPRLHAGSEFTGRQNEQGEYRVLGIGRGVDRDDCGKTALQACEHAVDDYFLRNRAIRPLDVVCRLDTNADYCAATAK